MSKKKTDNENDFGRRLTDRGGEKIITAEEYEKIMKDRKSEKGNKS